MSNNRYWELINKKSEELNSMLLDYWKEYSYIDTWQFWLSGLFMIIPLIVLLVLVDRKRIFEVLFFGFTVHMLWSYTDAILGSTSLFIHEYFLIPLLPFALSIASSVLPVGFLLIYQYTTNHKKSFFLYITITSAVFAFCFAPLESYMGLISMDHGMNYFYIFLIDMAIAVIAYWLTNFFRKFRTGD